ncbi:MAG: sugar ABC transporter ATP-binding protein [Spirochaetaceae bacterium]
MSYALRMEGIHKRFPGVHALRDVTFEVEAGTVHALVGENGAGKSTLMKLLSGSLRKDEGRIEIDGEEVELDSPAEAQARGVSMIYQELTVIPFRSVAANILLGREPRTAGGMLIDYRELHHRAVQLLDRIDVHVDPEEIVGQLSIAQQQMVEVAKALSLEAKIIIMDEPTSSLTDRETETLFRIIRELKRQGITVVYISHRLEEVFDIADRVTVLRDGQSVHTSAVDETDPDAVVRFMVGRTLTEFFPKHEAEIEETILEVDGLSGHRFNDVSFSLRKGEILGVSGLVGAGRSEMARALVGIDRASAGEIRYLGKTVALGSVRAMMRRGFVYVPEDRKEQGLFLRMTVRDNLTISSLERIFTFGLVRVRTIVELASEYVARLRIQTPSLQQLVRNLSGGNQQKVILARYLALEPRVLILDEPTRGIDVGAKAEIHDIIGSLAERGVSIIMISSELPEIVGVADRVLVMRQGRVAGELHGGEITQDAVMQKAAGGTAR